MVLALAAVILLSLLMPLVPAEGFATTQRSSSPRRASNFPRPQIRTHRRSNSGSAAAVALDAAPEGMHWFVKTEQFSKPFPEVKPHLEAHREWVRSLRERGDRTIVSGYRVDPEDRPGGGGLMLFAAEDYEAAEEFVRNDPLVANECVNWQLNKWVAETGDINVE